MSLFLFSGFPPLMNPPLSAFRPSPYAPIVPSWCPRFALFASALSSEALANMTPRPLSSARHGYRSLDRARHQDPRPRSTLSSPVRVGLGPVNSDRPPHGLSPSRWRADRAHRVLGTYGRPTNPLRGGRRSRRRFHPPAPPAFAATHAAPTRQRLRHHTCAIDARHNSKPSRARLFTSRSTAAGASMRRPCQNKEQADDHGPPVWLGKSHDRPPAVWTAEFLHPVKSPRPFFDPPTHWGFNRYGRDAVRRKQDASCAGDVHPVRNHTFHASRC